MPYHRREQTVMNHSSSGPIRKVREFYVNYGRSSKLCHKSMEQSITWLLSNKARRHRQSLCGFAQIMMMTDDAMSLECSAQSACL